MNGQDQAVSGGTVTAEMLAHPTVPLSQEIPQATRGENRIVGVGAGLLSRCEDERGGWGFWGGDKGGCLIGPSCDRNGGQDTEPAGLLQPWSETSDLFCC